MQQTGYLRYFSSSLCLSAVALAVVFSGCMDSGRTISDKVAEPPDVPLMAMAGGEDGLPDPLLSDESELASFELFTYDDIEKLPNTGRHRLLKEAVEYAIDQGILRKPAWAGRMVDAVLEERIKEERVTEEREVNEKAPDDAQTEKTADPADTKETVVATSEETVAVVSAKPSKPILFEPERAVSYGDFYKWHERFRLAIAEAAKPAPKPQGETKDDEAKDGQKKAAVTEPPASQPPAVEPVKLPPGPLAADLESHGEALSDKSGISRQQLCLLLALIAGQGDELAELDTAAVEAMAPEGASATQSLGDFRDYQSIDPDLRRFVGYAYQSGMLSRILGLSPDALSESAGLNPKKPVSRGEALTMLYWVLKKAN